MAWALAGWRNMPRLSHASSAAAGLAIAGCCLSCYWLGTRTKRAAAIAVATAHAEATAMASVQAATASNASVNLYLGGRAAEGASRAGHYLGLENAPWLVDAGRHADLTETDALEVAMADISDDVEDSVS